MENKTQVQHSMYDKTLAPRPHGAVQQRTKGGQSINLKADSSAPRGLGRRLAALGNGKPQLPRGVLEGAQRRAHSAQRTLTSRPHMAQQASSSGCAPRAAAESGSVGIQNSSASRVSMIGGSLSTLCGCGVTLADSDFGSLVPPLVGPFVSADAAER